MPEAKTIADEARGPLSSIDDAAARKEIGKLWTTLEGRLPATGKAAEPHTLATNADLTRVETALSKRIDAINGQSRQVIQSAGGGGVGGSGLLSSNNTWTGTNLFQKPTQFHWLAAGPLFLSAPTVMLPKEFVATVDIQMTSDAVNASQLGGSAALYVQHRAQGTGSGTTLVSAVRAQMETTQGSTGNATNDAVGGYFTILNRGTNANGFGLHVDAYHAAAGNTPNTYGCDVEMIGSQYAQTGKTVGYLLRSWGQGVYNRRTDYGFLASPDRSGSTARIEYPFSVGSDWIGPLNCAIAFDAAHCVASLAGLRLATNSPIVFDGPSQNAWSLRCLGVAMQMQIYGSPLTSWTGQGFFINSGTLGIVDAVTLPPSPNLSTPTGNLAHYGYVQVLLGGFSRWIPFFS